MLTSFLAGLGARLAVRSNNHLEANKCPSAETETEPQAIQIGQQATGSRGGQATHLLHLPTIAAPQPHCLHCQCPADPSVRSYCKVP